MTVNIYEKPWISRGRWTELLRGVYDDGVDMVEFSREKCNQRLEIEA